MRDIPNSNGFNTLQTKNKIATMPVTAGGTLNRTDYRSYRDFLESYQDNKTVKDDQESVSSTDSGISLCNPSNNTSTSSLNLDTCAKTSTKIEQTPAFNGRTGSFRNYLENYNNRKFSSVKPNAAAKPNLIKSEIVIRINEPKENGAPNEVVEAPNYPPPPPLYHENVETRCFAPPPPPPPPVLLNTNKPSSEFTNGKKWATVKTEDPCRKSGSPEKLPVNNNEAAANLAKVLKQHLLPRRRALEDQETLSKTTQSDETTTQKPSRIVQNFPRPPPKTTNENAEHNTTTVVPVSNGGKVSKDDPNVRKLVYNTYRGFLGAYNNKANDMIATLPRTMVREDQGVSKQLESMALQGALEKLNGRINPNVEKE